MIKILDPADENQKYFETGNYVQIDDRLYVKTEFSNCILELKIEKDGKLSCPHTNKTLGKFI